MASLGVDGKTYTMKERLIVAFDIGTTHSAVSFVHAYPGTEIDVRMVTRWPGQAEAAGDSKIPTIIAYKDAEAVAYGAEADEYLTDDEHAVAKWFKLHLHPDSMKINDQPPPYASTSTASSTIEIPALPADVTLKRVYAHFMTYLFRSTQAFFEKTTPNGTTICSRLASTMVIVLATPNGWDASQHLFLKQAAIEAGIVWSQQDAEDRLEFVTEDEASVHYALSRTNHQSWLRKGEMFCVCDCGGSTVDSTLYECKQRGPTLVLEEVCASECVQAGGVFVDRAARQMLEAKLANSKFNTEDCLTDMELAFEKKTKRLFDGIKDTHVIDFGSRMDNDRDYGILKGKLTLSREEVALAFNDVIRRIMDSCLRLLRGRKIRHLLLVGGFGESPYLQSRLREEFGGQNTEVVTVDDPSEGATVWYLKKLIVARVARYTLGVKCGYEYNEEIPGHYARRHFIVTDTAGVQVIHGGFQALFTKDTRIAEGEVRTVGLRDVGASPDNLANESSLYLCKDTPPEGWWTNVDGSPLARLRHLCNIKVDNSRIIQHLQPRLGRNGMPVWVIDADIVVAFDGRRLRAWSRWKENGVTKEGPVTILPGGTQMSDPAYATKKTACRVHRNYSL